MNDRKKWDEIADHVVYSGMIDEFFGYKLGMLEYRSLRFENEVLNMANFQGNAVVNYTDAETPYTRIIEHKHFAFGDQPKTVISYEFSKEWQCGDVPYYPVNDERNTLLYERYRVMAEKLPNVTFGGRLGSYQYYNMDTTVEAALETARRILCSNNS